MAIVTLTKTKVCADDQPGGTGRHVTLAITGAWNATKIIHIDNVKDRQLSEEERDMLLELWLRVHCNGKTLAALNTEFTNGVVAVI